MIEPGNISIWRLLAQVAEPGSEAVKQVGEQTVNEPGFFERFGSLWLPLLVMIVLWFLILGRPKRDQQQSQDTLAKLKKNDRVVTAGGILGTVVNIRDDTKSVTIRIDESTGTKMQVLRKSIVRIVREDEAKKDGKDN